MIIRFIALISLAICIQLKSQELILSNSGDADANNDPLMHKYPTPFTSHNKVLSMVLAFNLGHFDSLLLIINEYLSMCESGWDPTIAIFTGMKWPKGLRRFIRQKTFCYRTQSPLEVNIYEHDPKIGIGLGAEHRKHLANEVYNFDFFIYHEDDIVIKHSQIMAYLYETKKLHKLSPQDGLRDNCIGFQRYWKLPSIESYGEADVLETELLEEMPNFSPICIQNSPYLHVGGNIHQAMWMFTKAQVLMLQDKCMFLNQSNPSREYMSSFSVFDHKQGHCALNKIIPGDRFMSFSVLHYYKSKHPSWTPVFASDENLRAGYHYTQRGNIQHSVPDCWDQLINTSRTEQIGSEVIKRRNLNLARNNNQNTPKKFFYFF